jgi:hypothetical protein
MWQRSGAVKGGQCRQREVAAAKVRLYVDEKKERVEFKQGQPRDE